MFVVNNFCFVLFRYAFGDNGVNSIAKALKESSTISELSIRDTFKFIKYAFHNIHLLCT